MPSDGQPQEVTLRPHMPSSSQIQWACYKKSLVESGMGSTDWNVSIVDIHPTTIHLLLADTDTHYAAKRPGMAAELKRYLRRMPATILISLCSWRLRRAYLVGCLSQTPWDWEGRRGRRWTGGCGQLHASDVPGPALLPGCTAEIAQRLWYVKQVENSVVL